MKRKPLRLKVIREYADTVLVLVIEDQPEKVLPIAYAADWRRPQRWVWGWGWSKQFLRWVMEQKDVRLHCTIRGSVRKWLQAEGVLK